MDFHIKLPAKCILTGEHVIQNRGFALVLPCNQYQLSLKYSQNKNKTTNTVSGEGFSSMQVILWAVVTKALKLLNKDPHHLRGSFDIECNIPACSGLGFAAAFCVATASWAVHSGYIAKEKLFEFAVQIGEVFHKNSSGLDVAGVMAHTVTKYSAEGEIFPLTLKWSPMLYLSNCGDVTITESNNQRIDSLYGDDWQALNKIDEKMLEASILANEALEKTDYERGLKLLTNALNLGNECFYDWQLVSDKMDEHLTQLKKHALACKIIGAGFGGHVVSLWKEPPPTNLPFKLYRLL